MTTISRRTIVGAVWAAPVIVAVSAAPAAAASDGETHPLGMTASPASAHIRRSSSPPLSAPVTITITNNTGRAIGGSVTVAVPYRTDADVSVMEIDDVDDWIVTSIPGTTTLVSVAPLGEAESISFQCRFGSVGNLGSATVVGVVSFTAAAPGARTATLPVQVITVPR